MVTSDCQPPVVFANRIWKSDRQLFTNRPRQNWAAICRTLSYQISTMGPHSSKRPTWGELLCWNEVSGLCGMMRCIDGDTSFVGFSSKTQPKTSVTWIHIHDWNRSRRPARFKPQRLIHRPPFPRNKTETEVETASSRIYRGKTANVLLRLQLMYT